MRRVVGRSPFLLVDTVVLASAAVDYKASVWLSNVVLIDSLQHTFIPVALFLQRPAHVHCVQRSRHIQKDGHYQHVYSDTIFGVDILQPHIR